MTLYERLVTSAMDVKLQKVDALMAQRKYDEATRLLKEAMVILKERGSIGIVESFRRKT